MNLPLSIAVLAFGALNGFSQDKPACQDKPTPQDKASSQEKAGAQDPHHQGVVERGDHVMGFSHDKAAHHFRLYPDGGGIEVESNDAQDIATRDEIRMHFAHIMKMFAAGDFSAPMLIHAQNPPGSATMKKLRDVIQYKLENTERGGRIRITARNARPFGPCMNSYVFRLRITRPVIPSRYRVFRNN